jgi:hypothetical protein
MLQPNCTSSKGIPRAPFLSLHLDRLRLVDHFYHEQNGDCTLCKALLRTPTKSGAKPHLFAVQIGHDLYHPHHNTEETCAWS